MASPPKQAVFLSYASEDAPAALRICEALRAAGVEVWFDQSELRGGDVWDRQIRTQVHECALFIALVSRNSDARTEGYFRREWRLAVERTHDMADDTPFLLPVAIDDTPQISARVPDPFREVQWTRLPGGAATAAFVDRVRRLLSLDQPAAAVAASAAGSAGGGVPSGHANAMKRSGRSGRLWPAWLAIAALVLLAGYYGLDRHRSTDAAIPSAVTDSRARTPAGEPSAVPEKSIAVLPFVNMSSDKEQEYFSDGLSEELINLLAKIPDLRVSARTSSFYFKGKPTMIRDVARALGVANVLEGSVRKSGNTVRVSAQLVRADNGYPIWSDTYDRPLNDIFKIQDEIAGSVVDNLKVSLLGRQLPRAPRTANPAAYALYLQAEAIHYYRSSREETQHASDLLQQALKLDPAFAPAWAALARNLAVEYSLFGAVSLEQAHAQAHAAVEQALRIDPELAAAHQALGRVLYEVDWNWDAAATEIQKAISLEPGNAESYRLAGYIEITHGRFNTAVAALDKAISLDPLQAWNHIAKGYAAYRNGDLAGAERYYRRALELNPASAKFHYVLGSLKLVRGQPAAALEEMQRETDAGFRQCGLVLALDALGRKGEADQTLAIAEHELAGKKAFLIASIYAARKDRDRAFAWLDRAMRQRDGELLFIRGDPLMRNLVSDPRYLVLMQKLRHFG